MGLFISSLTTNQIIAATLTFMGMIVIMVMGFLQNTDIVGPIWKVVFKHLSYPELWDNALRGHLQVREMILQGSFAFFWLFLTVKVLEARRWS
jgi:ABC-2 type transport system permease protein